MRKIAAHHAAAVAARRQEVLDILTEAARDGLPCPTNEQLDAAVGGGERITTSKDDVEWLDEAGLISRTNVGRLRVITIPGVGSTAQNDVAARFRCGPRDPEEPDREAVAGWAAEHRPLYAGQNLRFKPTVSMVLA